MLDPTEETSTGDVLVPLIAFVDDDVVAEAEMVVSKEKPRYTNTRGAEKALFGLLTETESIAKLLEANFRVNWIPSADLRSVYCWAIQQYEGSGIAPTPTMFKDSDAPGFGGRSWAQVLDEHGIDIEHVPDESVEWVIEELHSRKLTKDLGEQVKRFSEAICTAPASDRPGMFQDWLTELNDYAADYLSGGKARRVVLTALSEIPVRATHWLWEERNTEGRLPLAGLSLLSGREGLGKSTIAAMLAAHVTQGTLPGYHYGKPKGVIIAATEDSFERTIVPRLRLAGADVTKVYRVEVEASGDVEQIDLPADLAALEKLIPAHDVALVILDPLTSRLEECLDTHKDADVRKALEKVVKVAERTDTAFLGIIHVNKSGSKDAGNLIMGSRAFSAVARANIMAMIHPEEPGLFVLSQAKNNWGRMDFEAITYRIEGGFVEKDGNGEDVWSSRIDRVGTDARFISDLLEAAATTKKESPRELAETWLTTYLNSRDRKAPASEVKAAAEECGISGPTLRRAKEALGIEAVRVPDVYPPQYEWRLPEDG